VIPQDGAGRRNQEEERKKVSQQTSRSNPKHAIRSHFGKLNEVIYKNIKAELVLEYLLCD